MQKQPISKYFTANKWIWTISSITILGTILRFYGLDFEGYSLDELSTIHIVTNYTFKDIVFLGKPPFFFISEYLWVKIFGSTEIAARSLNAVVGSISIPLIYLVGKELFNKKVGLISAYFLAISVFIIGHSQIIRYYSFFVFFAILSVYFYLHILKRNTILYYLIFSFISIVSFYNHYLSIFLIIALNTHFIINWKRFDLYRIKWILSQLLIFAFISIRLFRGFFKMSAGKTNVMGWISEPEIYSPLNTILSFIGDIAEYNPDLKMLIDLKISHLIIFSAIAFFLVSTAIYIYLTGYKTWVNNLRLLKYDAAVWKTNRVNILLVLVWLIFPLLLPLLCSYLFGPIYINRYTIAAAPAFYIFFGITFYYLRNVIPEYISVGFFTILIAPGLLTYYSEPDHTQYRESAYYLQENTDSNDLVLVSGWGSPTYFYWYYKGNAKRCKLLPRLKFDEETKSNLTKCIEDRADFWLVVTPGNKQSSKDLLLYLDKNGEFRASENISFKKIELYKYARDSFVE